MDQTSNIKLDKIIFMGTPEFAVPFLEYLINNSYKPILVITQPDRKKGRKQKIQSPPVKSLAEKFNIKITSIRIFWKFVKGNKSRNRV